MVCGNCGEAGARVSVCGDGRGVRVPVAALECSCGDALLEHDVIALLGEAVDVYERCASSVVAPDKVSEAAVVATILTAAAEVAWGQFRDEDG